MALCAAIIGKKKREQALESSSFFQSPFDEQNVPCSASEVQDDILRSASLKKGKEKQHTGIV